MLIVKISKNVVRSKVQIEKSIKHNNKHPTKN